MDLLLAMLLGPGLILAVPIAVSRESPARYISGFFVVTFGITIPCFVFLFSGYLAPVWKGGSSFGWLGCFHVGKLALSPLVLWACVAFYAIQFPRLNHRQAWIVMGLFNGVTVSGVCTALGLVIHSDSFESMFWMWIPCYTTYLYYALFVNLREQTEFKQRTYVFNFLATTPLWGVAIWWTKKFYDELPDQIPPSCFVVTAASKGGEKFVGPFRVIERAGESRQVNLQLLRFWNFEALWRSRSPRSHGCFRAIYNRLGPIIARRIRTRFAANFAYLCLKPFEWIAALVLRILR